MVAYRSGDGGRDHSGFDAILEAIYDQTNPIHRAGDLLAGRRVLWFDPNPAHNHRGRDLLRAASAERGDSGDALGERFVEARALDEAWIRLSVAGQVDLVICHWGHGLSARRRANSEELLRRVASLRAVGITVAPVVPFSGGGEYEAVNRRLALQLGAAELVARWEDPIAVLERVLGETFVGRRR